MSKTTTKLVINNRLDHKDPSALENNMFLNRLRDGKCTNYDWCHYSNSGSKYLISAEEWEQFSGDNVVCIYSKNKEVSECNIQCLETLGNYIVRINAEHNGNG